MVQDMELPAFLNYYNDEGMKKELVDKLVSIRRKIHANPEIGYQEYETAELICKELDGMGIPYRKQIAKTGVVAELKKGNGPLVILRADMDALPLREETTVDFKSTKKSTQWNRHSPYARLRARYACYHFAGCRACIKGC